MIVCVCKGLSSREIERHVRLGGGSLEELLRRTGAGTVCGACLPMLHEIAESAGGQPTEPGTPGTPGDPHRERPARSAGPEHTWPPDRTPGPSGAD